MKFMCARRIESVGHGILLFLFFFFFPVFLLPFFAKKEKRRFFSFPNEINLIGCNHGNTPTDSILKYDMISLRFAGNLKFMIRTIWRGNSFYASSFWLNAARSTVQIFRFARGRFTVVCDNSRIRQVKPEIRNYISPVIIYYLHHIRCYLSAGHSKRAIIIVLRSLEIAVEKYAFFFFLPLPRLMSCTCDDDDDDDVSYNFAKCIHFYKKKNFISFTFKYKSLPARVIRLKVPLVGNFKFLSEKIENINKRWV